MRRGRSTSQNNHVATLGNHDRLWIQIMVPRRSGASIVGGFPSALSGGAALRHNDLDWWHSGYHVLDITGLEKQAIIVASYHN